jgi:membrane protease YdiL (CAAX protease family)
MSIASTPRRSPRFTAFLDIALVVLASALAFLAEVAVAERLPWGAEARGVIAVLVGAVVAVVLTLRRGRSLRDLGFRRPRRWWLSPIWAIGIMIAFIVAQNVLPVLVNMIIPLPQPDMSRYDFIRGNLGAAIGMGLLLPLTAAIPEEIVYRGFLIERFSRLIGGKEDAPVLAVPAQALVFGAVHFQWGLGGVVLAMLMGVVWGFAFLLCGRNLWIVILAHSLAHVLLVMQLYSSQ